MVIFHSYVSLPEGILFRVTQYACDVSKVHKCILHKTRHTKPNMSAGWCSRQLFLNMFEWCSSVDVEMASNFPGGQSHLACGQQPAYTIYNWVYPRCNSVYGSALTLSGALWLFFTKNSGKSPCSMAKSTISMGKSTISMVIFPLREVFSVPGSPAKKKSSTFSTY